MAVLTVQGTGVTDNFILSTAPTTNFGTNISLAVGDNSAVARSLVKFDISSIPAGSTINSATLTLTVRNDNSINTRTWRVFRVLRAWVETESTWNIYSTGNNWGTAGAANTSTDREATDIGNVSVVDTKVQGDTIVFTLTASAIQTMITGGGFTNNGFLVQADTENLDEYDLYSTDEVTQTTRRPKLVIDYTAGGGSDDLYGYGQF